MDALGNLDGLSVSSAAALGQNIFTWFILFSLNAKKHSSSSIQMARCVVTMMTQSSESV
jgi:hypothetical protein